ncbi:Uncharacterised protein [Mycobacterium tuberculosis]|nr:Uncharacterised protein [Mycobacterium tuberculosis]
MSSATAVVVSTNGAISVRVTIAPLVPSTVAPPSKLLMKFARNQVPSSG